MTAYPLPIPAEAARTAHPDLRGYRLLADTEDLDDPLLVGPDGRVLDTWREGYPYNERMARPEYDGTSGCCRSSCSRCSRGSRRPVSVW